MPSTLHRPGAAAPGGDRLRTSAVGGWSVGPAAPLLGVLLVLAATAACRTPTAAPVAPTDVASQIAVPPLAPTPAPTATVSPTLGVVATTSLVGDVVKAVGGERVAVHVLVGPDSDPHDYKPSPGDLAAIEAATIVFENGLHLEVSLEPLLESIHPAHPAGDGGTVRIAVSDGIATMRGAAPADPADNPHVWWDPVRVKVWVANIAAALAAADPPGAAGYQTNAAAYAAELDALDTWIRTQTSALPPDRRVLVTDHEVLGYFAAAYGFTEIGAVVPSVSTEAEPSAKDLAALEAAIAAHGVTAIFTGETVPTALSERVAADTGTRLVPIFAEALSRPDGPAGTYVAFMRHNVTTIVEALR